MFSFQRRKVFYQKKGERSGLVFSIIILRMDYLTTNGDEEGVMIVENAQIDAVLGFHANSHREKLLIDTDPGIGEFFSFLKKKKIYSYIFSASKQRFL